MIKFVQSKCVIRILLSSFLSPASWEYILTGGPDVEGAVLWWKLLLSLALNPHVNGENIRFVLAAQIPNNVMSWVIFHQLVP